MMSFPQGAYVNSMSTSTFGGKLEQILRLKISLKNFVCLFGIPPEPLIHEARDATISEG